mmetsp:Transcript_6945/g.15201  ORF Transcript_6945/g.15201 Transcript_6945/m.15201 type:complete len:222 (-) Transcript_6945:512-1177(-)
MWASWRSSSSRTRTSRKWDSRPLSAAGYSTGSSRHHIAGLPHAPRQRPLLPSPWSWAARPREGPLRPRGASLCRGNARKAPLARSRSRCARSSLSPTAGVSADLRSSSGSPRSSGGSCSSCARVRRTKAVPRSSRPPSQVLRCNRPSRSRSGGRVMPLPRRSSLARRLTRPHRRVRLRRIPETYWRSPLPAQSAMQVLHAASPATARVACGANRPKSWRRL